jgi:Nucleotidyl transferase AbiEii toxin, Type IV TA system
MALPPTFPRLDILPPAQQAVWTELSQIPEAFTLYDRTAVALYLGHRQSVDFDFFGFEDFDPDTLLATLPLLDGAEVIQREHNTLTCNVKRGDWVQISFFGIPGVHRVRPATLVDDLGLKIASLVDLAGMKASVVQKRAQIKDYIDVDALIRAGVDLPTALASAGIIYGRSFNPLITLKALSWFSDGNLSKLPVDTRARLEAAVKAVNLNELPDLGTIMGGE